MREVVHAACPQVEEDMKWSTPAFMYKGILCGMAGFKAHAIFGFWKHSLVFGPDAVAADAAMGSFGRLTKLSELPPKKRLAGYVKKAMALNDAGIKVQRKPALRAGTPLTVPAVLVAALKKNKRARATFEAFSPSHKREYVEWITEAKSDDTRARRLQTAVEWMGEGKPRNWKYMKA